MELDKRTNEEVRKDYLEQVSHPGKFEREEIYAPYFYEQLLDGCADDYDVDGTLYSVMVVTDEDKELFPELSNVFAVLCHESAQGFFYCETLDSKEEYDRKVDILESESWREEED
jgi:hypothetical protein